MTFTESSLVGVLVVIALAAATYLSASAWWMLRKMRESER